MYVVSVAFVCVACGGGGGKKFGFQLLAAADAYEERTR